MAIVKKTRRCAPPVFHYRNVARNRFRCAKPFTSKFLRCLMDIAHWKPIDHDSGPCTIELGVIDEDAPMSNANVCIRRSLTPLGARWFKPPPLAQAHRASAQRALFKAKLEHDRKYPIPPADQTAFVAHKNADAVSK